MKRQVLVIQHWYSPARLRIRLRYFALIGVLILVLGNVTIFQAAETAASDRAPLATVPSTPLSGVTDLDGHEIDPFSKSNTTATVLVFISIDCPICNRYAPEIQRLQAAFSKRGVQFWLVQPDSDESIEKTRTHLREYGYSFGLLRDTKRALVKKAQAAVTPEAAVFDAAGKLVYHGRIDNRFADYGKQRPEASKHDLQEVLEAVLAGHPVLTARTPAVGCYIPN